MVATHVRTKISLQNSGIDRREGRDILDREGVVRFESSMSYIHVCSVGFVFFDVGQPTTTGGGERARVGMPKPTGFASE